MPNIDPKVRAEAALEGIKKLSPFDRLIYWIKEREGIRYGKEELRTPKPWTPDPILQNYRFCNVRREHDKVTRWIAKHWREPHKDDPNLWFAMVVARLINWPDTLKSIGYPIQTKYVWRKKWFLQACKSRQDKKLKVFTGAYMIHADATHGGTKADYLADMVLDPLWKDRDIISVATHSTLEAMFLTLRGYRDMGEFMSGQVVADLKYVEPLSEAEDWWTWATPGPGSRRGLNRLLGRHPNEKWKVSDWQKELAKLRIELNRKLQWKESLHAQDVQSCLCEFDKYCRVLFSEGKPRSKYKGA